MESMKDIIDQMNCYFDSEKEIDHQEVDGNQISPIQFHLASEYFDDFS